MFKDSLSHGPLCEISRKGKSGRTELRSGCLGPNQTAVGSFWETLWNRIAVVIAQLRERATNHRGHTSNGGILWHVN